MTVIKKGIWDAESQHKYLGFKDSKGLCYAADRDGVHRKLLRQMW